MTYGVASMTAPLKEVALRRPGKSIITAEPSAWNYGKSVSYTHLTLPTS